MVLTNNIRPRKARELPARIDHQLDLWERVIHAGLVGDALAEKRAREGRIDQHNEEKEDRWCVAFTAHCCQVSCDKRSIGPPTVRVGGLLPLEVFTDTR